MGEAELREQVSQLLPVIGSQQDEELVQSIWPSLKSEFAREGFGGSSPLDTIVEWSRTELLRVCRKAGDLGAKVLSYLQDPNTQHDVERTAIISGFLLAHFTHTHVELHAMTALAVLIVRLSSRRGATPH